MHVPVQTPIVLLRLVWPLPRSLATTYGISFDFSSSPYLDVSVREVPSIRLFDSAYRSWFFIMKVSPFRNPRIEAYLQLPVAYRSLSRLSSAPDAKAFTLCSCSLELFLWEVLPSLLVHSILSRIAESRFTVYLGLNSPITEWLAKLCLLPFFYLGKTFNLSIKIFSLVIDLHFFRSTTILFRVSHFSFLFIRFSMNISSFDFKLNLH